MRSVTAALLALLFVLTIHNVAIAQQDPPPQTEQPDTETEEEEEEEPDCD